MAWVAGFVHIRRNGQEWCPVARDKFIKKQIPRMRHSAQFLPVSSNLDTPTCPGHLYKAICAFPTPLDTPRGPPGVPLIQYRGSRDPNWTFPGGPPGVSRGVGNAQNAPYRWPGHVGVSRFDETGKNCALWRMRGSACFFVALPFARMCSASETQAGDRYFGGGNPIFLP